MSDGTRQHFESNRNILYLTYHSIDFGISASWTLCVTANGKGAVDGIGAAIKHPANREVFSSNSSCVILTSEDLYIFTRRNTTINFSVWIETVADKILNDMACTLDRISTMLIVNIEAF